MVDSFKGYYYKDKYYCNIVFFRGKTKYTKLF